MAVCSFATMVLKKVDCEECVMSCWKRIGSNEGFGEVRFEHCVYTNLWVSEECVIVIMRKTNGINMSDCDSSSVF